MHAVDTNVLVRLITRDDPKQSAAAESFVSAGAWVGHLVLAEMTWVLRTVYALGPTAIAAAVEVLLDHQRLTIQDPEVVAAALDHYRDDPRMSFTDCLVLEIARKAGHLPLGTFDRQLARLDGAQKL
jgi:predicted nucleic-acid-binding protein